MIKPRNQSPEGMGRADYGLVNILSSMDTQETLDKFKWFISEREEIRSKKERGEERPWTDDEVLDKTKFTNIYRQHDKVSKSIFSSCSSLDGPVLV